MNNIFFLFVVAFLFQPVLGTYLPFSQDSLPVCLVILTVRLSRNDVASKVEFFGFFLLMYVILHCFICRPSDSTVSEDAGIEPRTVATLALTARRSKR
jgi:hypothetical protein